MIELSGVTKRFGAVTAVDAVDLTVAPGEFLTLVGPSGCGKTTLLRLLAGFEQPDSGSIRIAGRNVVGLPPNRRDLNQVFQNYALFPHLSVRENIAFGLRMQNQPAADIRTRVAEAMALVELEGLEERRPHQLSGGQRQRVALARALAPRPSVLLLDEPLSALDAKLRLQVQGELKELQRRLGLTFVFVTHDRAEALAMGDRIAVMNGGRIEQVGPPAEVYRRARTAFVADFISEANLMAAELIGQEDGSARLRLECGALMRVPSARWAGSSRTGLVSFRPEKLTLTEGEPAGEGGFPVRVLAVMFHGALERLILEAAGGRRLVALIAARDAPAGGGQEGGRLWCRVASEDLTVLPASESMPLP